jgi:hypothetical protein
MKDGVIAGLRGAERKTGQDLILYGVWKITSTDGESEQVRIQYLLIYAEQLVNAIALRGGDIHKVTQ